MKESIVKVIEFSIAIIGNMLPRKGARRGGLRGRGRGIGHNQPTEGQADLLLKRMWLLCLLTQSRDYLQNGSELVCAPVVPLA